MLIFWIFYIHKIIQKRNIMVSTQAHPSLLSKTLFKDIVKILPSPNFWTVVYENTQLANVLHYLLFHNTCLFHFNLMVGITNWVFNSRSVHFQNLKKKKNPRCFLRHMNPTQAQEVKVLPPNTFHLLVRNTSSCLISSGRSSITSAI